MNFSNLSWFELFCLKTGFRRNNASKRHVEFLGGLNVRLTPRGVAYYSAARVLHGLSADPVAKVKTVEQLIEMKSAMTAVRLAAHFGRSGRGVNIERAQRSMHILRKSSIKQLREILAVHEGDHDGSSGSVVRVDFQLGARVA